MRYLLDTCMILWMLEGNRRRIKDFIDIIENPENDLAISVVSYWEITIKKALGKIELTNDWTDQIEATGLSWLNLEPKHIQPLEKLPLLHHDPFDRLLISQAKAEQIILLTHDEKIKKYFP
jgi:PIN domain nuclease of toxin-antitoxin system